MTDQPASPQPQPGPLPIPYVEAHDGPRRVLLLPLSRSGNVPGVPQVGVDGRSYVVV